MTEYTASETIRWIPIVPLAAALIHALLIAVLRRPLTRAGVISISVGAALVSLALTLAAFSELVGLETATPRLVDRVYTWVGVGLGSSSFTADLAFQFDALSAVMCLVVTGVGSLIHIYSVGYMDHDRRDDGGYQRFFCYLNLFLCSMLVLVLADNLLLMFLGWEGVGLCSYLLIGFWFSDRENVYAGSKAFIVNRIGDFGFLIGLLLLFWSLASAGEASVSFRNIEANIGLIADAELTLPGWLGGAVMGLPGVIGLCFFLAACGKSAQGPLYVWLPDAMAGPTPVSALIHAATMVTAGVYLVCRLSFLYAIAPEASAVMAWTGALTALFAATIAVAQTDIKKVLAYSTVSQLGYMFLAAGCGAYTAAMFHLVTHAFFKALLFMGAGAVILAMDHEQDLRKMGGLRVKLVLVHLAMLPGVCAISGFPLLSGFFSKDEILVATFASHSIPGAGLLYAIALLTAGLTAFYIWRLFFLVFYGASRLPARVRTRRMEDPERWIMLPLYILATLAIFGGMLGLPQFWGDLLFGVENSDSLANFLTQVVVAATPHEVERGTEWSLMLAALGMSLAGFGVAFQLYVRRPHLPQRVRARLGVLHRLLVARFYVDEFYDALLVRPLVRISDRLLFRRIDAGLIDGLLVNGSARAVRGLAAHALKHAQSGMTQGYLFFMVAGTLAIVGYLLF